METSTIDESMAESGPDENFAEFTDKEVIADMCEAECVHQGGDASANVVPKLLQMTIAVSVDASAAVEDLETKTVPPQPWMSPVVDLEAYEATQKNYEATLVAVLDEYAAGVQSLHEACAEIEGLRARLKHAEDENKRLRRDLQVSETETEDAQTTANLTWMEAETLRAEVARLNCQAEKLRTEMAKLETDAEGSEQLLMGQLGKATDRIVFLEHQLTNVL